MHPVLASVYKIVLHSDRVRDYLEGKTIQPVLLELGVTTRCNRACPDCPSGLGEPGLELGLDTISRLFEMLEGRAPGLIITGGEPTCHSRITDILDRARRHGGFREIAVVTNGSLLDRDDIAAALVSDASAVRVSYYDHGRTGAQGGENTLRRIRKLRDEIDAADSPLEIGVSVLTGDASADLEEIAARVRQAGAHWLYFHPTCLRSVHGLRQVSQAETLRRIEKLRDSWADAFPVFTLTERYSRRKLHFEGYHAAHFIWVIGADGVNYAGTEVKYRPEYALTDLKLFRSTLVWNEERGNRIARISSAHYDALGSRNRSSLYSDLLQRLVDGQIRLEDLEEKIAGMSFHMPSII